MFWVCLFSYSLGRYEFSVIVFFIIRSVYCVFMFFDILRRWIFLVFGLGFLGVRRVVKLLGIDRALFC